MDTIAKIYDTLLLNRLRLWYSIDKCQAGGQKGRSCLEQILSLRLLIDFALFKKLKLYIVFIDFSKAYDRVPRNKLVEYMRSIGCGRVMLYALRGMYRCTYNVLKSAVISASAGVRQGAPTSCLLFVVYIDKMIKMIRQVTPIDGFLGSLHALMLMDDTVILATSRDMCVEKLDAVLNYCSEYGMEINERKTRFFVINNEQVDKLHLNVQGRIIEYCSTYLYLGAWFKDDGSNKSVLMLHQPSHQEVVNKFAIFCAVNTGMPYCYKLMVMEAAASASLFYSSESWLTANPNSVVKAYNQLVKCLLGVRVNTSVHLCLAESGIPTANYVIEKRRRNFLLTKMRNRNAEEPFHIVFDMCRSANSPGYKFLEKSLQGDIHRDSLEPIHTLIRSKPQSSTKYATYRSELNPTLTVHNIYDKNVYIPDYLRVAFTRFRLMSHNLKVETGRWSRIAREQRVCQCDNISVQDEKHVLIVCPMSNPSRNRYNMLTFDTLDVLIDNDDILNLCKYIYEVFRLYG